MAAVHKVIESTQTLPVSFPSFRTASSTRKIVFILSLTLKYTSSKGKGKKGKNQYFLSSNTLKYVLGMIMILYINLYIMVEVKAYSKKGVGYAKVYSQQISIEVEYSENHKI